MQHPSVLGFKLHSVDGYRLLRVLGRSELNTVFAATKTDSVSSTTVSTCEEVCEEVSVKIFDEECDFHHEVDMLTRLKVILSASEQDLSAVPNVSYDENGVLSSAVEATEVVQGERFRGIVTLPMCRLIRPSRSGVTLTADHILQLLATLEVVHEGGMLNCDIKPDNILIRNDRTVLCDWGSARCINPVTKRYDRLSSGTVGYSDFTIGLILGPTAAHDLMALVRTVYVNYTTNTPPSVRSESDEFWAQRLREGSVWGDLNEAAASEDYGALKVLFCKL